MQRSIDMTPVSWIFIAVFGIASIVALTSIVCKYIYAKKTAMLMKRACNFTEEERAIYKKMLKDNSNSLGVNIFELLDDE